MKTFFTWLACVPLALAQWVYENKKLVRNMMALIALAAFVAICSGCPLPPPDNCTPLATRCSPEGVPQRCSQSQRWSAGTVSTRCPSSSVCCLARSPYGGRLVHACVPAAMCVPGPSTDSLGGDAGHMGPTSSVNDVPDRGARYAKLLPNCGQSLHASTIPLDDFQHRLGTELRQRVSLANVVGASPRRDGRVVGTFGTSPEATMPNRGDRGWRNTEGLGNRVLGRVASKHLPNVSDLILGQLGARRDTPPPLAALRHHIARVVLKGSQEQMGQIHARRSVAAVQDTPPVFNGPMAEDPGQPVRPPRRALRPENTVSIRVATCGPKAAPGVWVQTSLSKKSREIRIGWRHRTNLTTGLAKPSGNVHACVPESLCLPERTDGGAE